jgi:hypothetical protein
MVDGVRTDPVRRVGDTVEFKLLRPAEQVRLVSRTGVPAELGTARDPRRLGVAVKQIAAWRGARVRVMNLSDPARLDGFHAFEAPLSIRWTDGDVALPADLFDGFGGAFDLAVRLGGAARYPE